MQSASIEPFEVVRFAPEHRFGFGAFLKQATIDQRRQILATFGGELEAVLDRTGHGEREDFLRASRKKRRARAPR